MTGSPPSAQPHPQPPEPIRLPPYTPTFRVTGDEVVAHRFTQVRRNGYDPIEVDVFLERIASVLDHLNAEINEQRGAEYRSLELLRHAQVVADRIIRSAELRAEMIVANADARAADQNQADVTVSSVMVDVAAEFPSALTSASREVVDLRRHEAWRPRLAGH